FDLFSGRQILQCGDPRPRKLGGFDVEDDGESGVAGGGVFQQFADVGGAAIRQACVQAGGAQGGGDERELGLGGIVGGDDEGIDGGHDVGGEEALVGQDEGEDDVAHAETDGGEWGTAHEFDEFVVAAS